MKLSETCFCDARFEVEDDSSNACTEAMKGWRDMHRLICPSRRLSATHSARDVVTEIGFTSDYTRYGRGLQGPEERQ